MDSSRGKHCVKIVLTFLNSNFLGLTSRSPTEDWKILRAKIDLEESGKKSTLSITSMLYCRRGHEGPLLRNIFFRDLVVVVIGVYARTRALGIICRGECILCCRG